MINVLNNTLEEVPEPEVSCKFLTDRTSANSLSLGAAGIKKYGRNKEKEFLWPYPQRFGCWLTTITGRVVGLLCKI